MPTEMLIDMPLDHAPSWKHFSVMHVHMIEPKSKLVEPAAEDEEVDSSGASDESDSSVSNSGVSTRNDGDEPSTNLATITEHYLHGGGSAPAEAAANAASGGAAGIGALMQHADAMLRSDKAQLAAAHTAHKGDMEDVLRERWHMPHPTPSILLSCPTSLYRLLLHRSLSSLIVLHPL